MVKTNTKMVIDRNLGEMENIDGLIFYPVESFYPAEHLTDIEYLALPYTHDDESVKEFRVAVSDAVAAHLTEQGRIIFPPISCYHHIAKKYKLPTDYKYWQKLDEEFLKISKTLIIITLDGWEKSNGVTWERGIAEKYGIPEEFFDPAEHVREILKNIKYLESA